MEKELCRIRKIQRAVNLFEIHFEKLHGVCFNEGMALCTLSKTDRLSSGELSESLGLTLSNTSKVIRSIEDKGLIERGLGQEDKRQMYFALTDKGRELLTKINCEVMEIPDILKDLMD